MYGHSKAGRKAHLEDKTKEEIMRMSAATVLRALRSKELSFEFRASLARDFVIKSMPTKIEGHERHLHVNINAYLDELSPEELRSLATGRTIEAIRQIPVGVSEVRPIENQNEVRRD